MNAACTVWDLLGKWHNMLEIIGSEVACCREAKKLLRTFHNETFRTPFAFEVLE
jgi:hypothetical protein